MPHKDKEDRRAYERTYWGDNKEKSREKKQSWRKSAPVVESQKKLKIEVLTHYGGNELICVRCGFGDTRALTIDHMGNNGYSHRKALGFSGKAFYRWLKKEGYPPEYQTLCMNCQFIKREEVLYGTNREANSSRYS